MKTNDKYLTFLLSQAQNGNRNSFLQIIELTQKKIFTLALQLSGDFEMAEELTKETFLKSWSFLNLVNDYIPFELWIRGITTSVFFSKFKNEIESSDKKLDAEHSDREIQARNDYDKLFLELPLIARQILILHDLEGYKINDISSIFESYSSDVLLNHLNSARKKITTTETISILESYSENEWISLISDFDTWDMNANSNLDYLVNLKVIKEYRDNLETLLSENNVLENIIKDITSAFFEESSSAVSRKKEAEEKVKLSIKKQKSAPKSNIFQEVAATFAKSSSKKDISEIFIKQNHRRKRNKIFSYSGFIIVIFLIILFAIPGQHSFNVTENKGVCLINDVQLLNDDFEEGDIIQTKQDAECRLNLGNSEVIILKENSTLVFDKYENDVISLNLRSGNIKFLTLESEDKINLIFGDFSLLVNGADGSVTFGSDKKYDNFISVSKGNLDIKYKGNEIFLVKNYRLEIGSFVPYFIKNTPQFKDLLQKINLPVKDYLYISELVSMVSEADALTLWHLLKYSEGDAKTKLYEKLFSFFPHTQFKMNKDNLNLTDELLKIWLKEITWKL